MLKIFKNVFFFKVVKTNTKKERLENPKKGKVVVNTWKHRVLNVSKTKITIEYR